MARRSSTPVADAPVTDTVDETVTDTETVPASPEVAEAEAAAAEGSEPEAEAADVTAILTALDTVLSGDLSDLEAVNFTPVIEIYNGYDRKHKAAATREITAKSQTLLESGDFDKARAALLAGKATKASKPKGESKPRTPADVTSPVVEKLAAFQLAYGVLSANLPEGIAEDWQAQVTTAFESGQAEVESYRVWLSADPETRGDAPEVSGAAALAARIAFKNTRKPYGQRHDVGTHIEQVFADAESGTFMSEAEIAGAKSDEYGDDTCSTSAVTARLNKAEEGKALSEGLSVETREGKRGVVKA